METKIFNQRLIKFAKHLANIKTHVKMGEYGSAIFCDIAYNKQVEFDVCFHAWIFDDLPLLFNEWYFNSRLGQPFLKDLNEEEGSVSGVFDWFGLTPQEFVHLFDITGMQQPYYYGGTFLTKKSTAQQISKNIFEFIQHRSALTHLNPELN